MMKKKEKKKKKRRNELSRSRLSFFVFEGKTKIITKDFSLFPESLEENRSCKRALLGGEQGVDVVVLVCVLLFYFYFFRRKRR